MIGKIGQFVVMGYVCDVCFGFVLFGDVDYCDQIVVVVVEGDVLVEGQYFDFVVVCV